MRMPMIALAVLTCAASPGLAATRGTPTEAQEMLRKAVDHYKEAGRKQALADFNAGKAPFRDRDLYVFCVAGDRTIVANGAFPSYVGTSADKLVDTKGNPLGEALWIAAAKTPTGSIQYPMLNPATGKVEQKTTLYSKPADDLICGVGAYSVP